MTETDFSLAEALKTTGMSSYKILALIALFAVSSCKSPTLSFKKNQINGNFINTSFSELYGSMAKFLADSIANDTIKYEARFEQRLVNIDRIGQFKITNSLSEHKSLIKSIGSSHIIYLYFYVNGGVEKVLFVSSYFNEKKVCVSLGPAYTGLVSRDNIQLLKKYNIKKKGEQFYLSQNHIEDVDIRFYSQAKFRDEEGNYKNNIVFDQVIRKKDISPAEYLVFDIPQVFQDSSALKFSIQK